MTKRMFIVDDEPTFVELCAAILQRKGFEVVGSALDGDEAISRISRLKDGVDMVLMDYRMPRRNGLETMSELQKVDSELKVLFMSADETVRDRALENGAVGFLTKPFVMSELIGAIRRAFGTPDDERGMAT